VDICGNTPSAPRLTLVETLLELYELDAASTHLDALLREDALNARARFARGRLLFMRDDHQGCLTQLEALLSWLQKNQQLVGRTKGVELLMAESLRRLGRADEAESRRKLAMQRSEARWPDPIMDEVNTHKTGLKADLVDADLLYGRKQYDKSIALLRKTVKAYPDSLWAHILLARALIRTGAPDSKQPDREDRLAEAQQLLDAALKIDPQSVEAQFRLAVALGYEGKIQEAAGWYEKAIELKPDFTMAHYNLANCRLKQSNIDGTIEALQGAVRSQPDFVDGRFLLGYYLFRQGRYAESEPHVRAANQLKPNDPKIRRLLQRVADMRVIMQE
jgi:tetratricopeptide (TPR) repeat protein